MRIRVSHDMLPPAAIMRELGVDERGKLQAYATGRILLHMRGYMPFLTGQTATGQTYAESPTTIVVNAPYARYLYYGKKMRAPGNDGPFPILGPAGTFEGEFRYRKGAHPVPTEEDLTYTRTVNEDAGPYWDRTMVQRVGPQIVQEITEYARRLH